jgi:protein-tyrosine phosphatase
LTGVALDIAFVCTGNRFRSPLAAALLAEETKDLPVAIASLGTLDLGAVPALPEAIELARSYGLDLSDHHSRNIAEVDLEPYDLVLGFEHVHVAGAVVDGGARVERTFTLPELVDLLDAIPGPPLQPEAVERARVRIRQAHAARPPDFRARAVPEIADPLGQTPPRQRETAGELRDLVIHLAKRLFS